MLWRQSPVLEFTAYACTQRSTGATECCFCCNTSCALQAEAKAKVPTSNLDVSNSVVETSFRTGTEAAESEEQASTSTTAQVLFVSESNVCRSVLAEAILKQQLKDCGLDSIVNVQSKVSSHKTHPKWYCSSEHALCFGGLDRALLRVRCAVAMPSGLLHGQSCELQLICTMVL